MKIALRSPDNSVWKVAAREQRSKTVNFMPINIDSHFTFERILFARFACDLPHAKDYIYNYLLHIAYETISTSAIKTV